MGQGLDHHGPSLLHCTFRGFAPFFDPLTRKMLSYPDIQFCICLRGLRSPALCSHPVIFSLTLITTQEAQNATLDKWSN